MLGVVRRAGGALVQQDVRVNQEEIMHLMEEIHHEEKHDVSMEEAWENGISSVLSCSTPFPIIGGTNCIRSSRISHRTWQSALHCR